MTTRLDDLVDEDSHARMLAEIDADIAHAQYLADLEDDREEAFALAEADAATGAAEILPGVKVVRTSGDRAPAPTTPDRFDDEEYDAFDALLDGSPRW